MVLMITTTLVSSFCEFSAEIQAQNDFGTYLQTFSIQLDPREIKFMNECLPEKAGGDLMKILEVPSFENLRTLLDGFSSFNNLKSQLDSAPEESVSITETTKIWAQMRDGQLPTHENIVESLA